MNIGNLKNTGAVPYAANKKTEAEGLYAGITSAAEMTKEDNDGKIIGLTMIPYENTNISYGMKAQYAKDSTSDNPIVQVSSNYGGKSVSYNVNINEVNPESASQLEMFAFLSYADDQGMTVKSTYGSYQQMKVYADNANHNGYCANLSGYDTFITEKFDWFSIMKGVMNDYLEAGIYGQYQKCKNLLENLKEITSNNLNKETQIDM